MLLKDFIKLIETNTKGLKIWLYYNSVTIDANGNEHVAGHYRALSAKELRYVLDRMSVDLIMNTDKQVLIMFGTKELNIHISNYFENIDEISLLLQQRIDEISDLKDKLMILE